MQTENTFNKIEISITKAQLTGIAFAIRDEEPSVPHISIGLSLMSVGGHKVTDITLGTNQWQEGSKLKLEDIPPAVFEYIGLIRQLIEPVCVKKINSIDKFIS